MAIDPRISLGIQPIQLVDPLTQYGQIANIQHAQNQNALAAYQLNAAKREQESVNALNQAYAAAYDPATGKIDNNLLRKTMAESGFGSKLPGLEKTLTEIEKEKASLAETQGKVAAQPTALAKQQTELVDLKLKQSRQFLDTINPTDPNAPQAYVNWIKASHADPIIGPELTARGTTLEQSLARVQQAISQGPQAFADFLNQSKLGVEKFMEMNKPTTNVINQGGQSQIVQIPGLGGQPKTVGTYADVALPADVEAQKARIAKAGATNVNVSTEKAYSGQFANKVADADIAKLNTAEKAPEMAANADRVLALLKSGKVFTGSAADIKLNIAKGLNVLGANNDEKIANTEVLISGLAKNTLNAVKSSGLGSGQGFTDKDLQFLQDAEGGRITLNAQTLERLANLSRKTAEASAEAWNKRVKQIPKSATEGTGLNTEPISVPKRNTGIAAPAVGSVQNGYRFKGGDPAVQTNWEKQ